jgi:hypothetical protein
VTRTWVGAKDDRWIMICDQIGCVTRSEPFPPGVQPPLEIFAERGWFIARKFGDVCPACLAAGVVPTVERWTPRAEREGL